ncbi:2,3-bisphosphoglycerate-independent phosphoglycerate mutase [Spirochaeta africana]|uniref:2,3-bisphosphoglycerate-independent phosphoglycerate mutase n=1 Tax=Spirochaeta africana (strain ATCC 700263 / DSM 8902 / Z-7692) TaxID=889378 RepID=H9UGI6_SPIAZ|nr:2,3-bisphosphoglycerate-independent phosphoglycerate mutase [Spirochaeta africana]AFG36629.1 2,3-bisphosphoglycerate-independent phosphoglycerate mutase [Spirochaeta africana DSM 8902]
MAPKPVVLIVRDGWGRNPNPDQHDYNAVELANTPCSDTLLKKYPWVQIATSGEDVGLPEGTMGNSEVGHQNLGAGRIVYQDSVRITKAIREGDFFRNESLTAGIERAKKNAGWVHIMGLASDAGVHALLNHLYASVEMCKKLGQTKVAVHLFTDGRDTGPYTGIEFIRQIEEKLAEIGIGQVASITGRYWAMDRDNRWERVKRAYDMLTGRATDLPVFDTATEAMQHYYDNPDNDSQTGDEFVTPRFVGSDWQETRMKDGDSAIFYNFRGDRPREIIRSFVMDDFYGSVKPSPDSGEKGFDRGSKLDIFWVTMTAYEAELSTMVNVAFPKPGKMVNISGEYLSKKGLTQFRCAETEKFPHVTFFFNDYRDEPFDGETHQMAQSPKVATYDLQPEMSAGQVRDLVLGRIKADDCEDFILVNFANGDMVGHTGKLDAAIKACETVDACVQEIVDATLARGGKLVVTADHGNAEQMYAPEIKSAHTSHTTYDVDCIIVDPDLTDKASGAPDSPSAALRGDGRLADVMPTVLQLMGLEKPAEMSGSSLIK